MLVLSETDSVNESSISYSDYSISRCSCKFFAELLKVMYMNMCSDQSSQILSV